MNSKRLLIVSLLPLVLAGCPFGKTKPDVPPEPIVKIEYVYPDCGTPPRRDYVQLRSVQWIVTEEGEFKLTAEGYEDLSYNISEILGAIRQLTSEIGYYEQCLSENG